MRNISISSITTFAHCGRKWEFNYLQKIKLPVTSPHLIFGTAVHKAIEDLSRSISANGEFSISDMHSSFQESWEKGIDENNITWMNSTQSNKMFECGLQLINEYYYQMSDYRPVTIDGKPAIELYFQAPIYLENGSVDPDNQLHGYIDLIAKMGNGDIIIFDHKTSSTPYSDYKIQTNSQLAVYSHAFRTMYPGKTEDYVCFNVLMKKYRVDPWVERKKRKVTDLDIEILMQEVRTFIKGIDNEIYLPNRGDHCDNKFVGCDFLKHCVNYGRESDWLE